MLSCLAQLAGRRDAREAAEECVRLYAVAVADDKRWGLIEDIIEGIAQGDVASSLDSFSVERRDDGSVLEVDLGDPDVVYVVTVSSVERVD